MAYLNANSSATSLVDLHSMAPGWVVGEFKFGASPTVTTGDVIDIFSTGTALGFFVADWFVAMEQVDTGAYVKEMDVTMTAGVPGVVNWVGHVLPEGALITFTARSGSLPLSIFLGTQYYVRNPTTDAFNISATPTGSLLTFSGSPTGTVHAVANVGVTFNIGVAGDQTAISGTSGLRWESNVYDLGRSSTVSMHRAANGQHFMQNGHNNRIGLQCTNLPVSPNWANKRVWMGLLLLPVGSMG